jgi:hypothetical protein
VKRKKNVTAAWGNRNYERGKRNNSLGTKSKKKKQIERW